MSNPIRVTFDSNVIDICLGLKQAKIEDAIAFRAIQSAIDDGLILPCVSVEYFVLEGQWSKRYRSRELLKPPQFGAIINKCDSVATTFMTSRAISLNDYSRDALRLLRNLGGKIITCNRFGLPFCSDFNIDCDFLDNNAVGVSSDERDQIFCSVLEFIETLNCGERFVREKCGVKDREGGIFGIIDRSPLRATEKGSLYGELADCDMVASHVAYRNEALCTYDRGGCFKSRAVLHPDNVKRLKDRFNLTVVQPEQLVEMLALF